MLALVSLVVAEEKVLLSFENSAAIGDGIEYNANFLATSESGHFSSKNLKILPVGEKGFRAMATDVKPFATSHYQFEPPYPAILNKDVEGAGAIENASTIKSITVTDVQLNRPYDTLYLLYSTSPTGPVKKVKLTPYMEGQDGQRVKGVQVQTMTPINFIYENESYNNDVRSREIKATPAFGANNSGIYFRGLVIQTNQAFGNNEHSPWSMAYFKNITVVYDKAFTDEQWAERQALAEEWNIDDGSKALTEKALNDIQYRKQLEAIEAEKMHKDDGGTD